MMSKFSYAVGAGVLAGMLLAGCGRDKEPVGRSATAPVASESSENGEYTRSEPTLLPVRPGTEDDLELTDEEIEQAKARMEAEEGFIAIIAPTFETDYHFSVASTALKRAEDLDLPAEVHSAGTSPEQATAVIEDAAKRGAIALIVDIFDPTIRQALEATLAQGMYIVQYAGRTGADLGVVTISIEDADLGSVAGAFAGQLIQQEFGGRANVAILDFPVAPQVVVRAEAIRESLLAVAPEANIVGNYKGGTTEFGFEAMTQALGEHPEINVVVSINDAGAYGAYQVLSAAGRTATNTIIVGIDGEAQALEYIAEGTMYRGTVDTNPKLTGEMVVHAVVKLLAGSTLPQNIRVPVKLIEANTLQ